MNRQSCPDSAEIEVASVCSKADVARKEGDSVDRRFVTERSMKPIS